MIHPFFENQKQLVQYILIWILYAVLQALVLGWLVQLPFWMLLLDGLLHAAIFGVLCILILNVIKYGNFAALQLYQRIVNHIALVILSLSVWLGAGFGLIYIFFGLESAVLFIPVMPIRGFIGLLIYFIIVQRFRSTLSKNETTTAIPETLAISEDTKPKESDQKEKIERIAVKSGTKIHVILVSEILFLQSDGDYVQIVTLQGKYLKEQTMKFFEEHLPENRFVRVHRSYIVNVEMISRIELYEKQNQLLILKNGQQIKTSPSGYNSLRLALNL
jgi:hypothetical protein